MLQLNEQNFDQALKDHPSLLVFFYRESGCSFCTKMKPVVEKYGETNPVGWYALGPSPDSVTEGLVKNFPTFAAYVDGKLVGVQEGAMPLEQLGLTFTPEKIPAKDLPIEKAAMLQLLTEEANTMDKIAPLRAHLLLVQAEIKRRKDLANGV